MGLFFKSEEEKKQIAEKKEQEREQVRNSVLTHIILDCIDKEFSEDGELLRTLRSIDRGYVEVRAYEDCVFASFKNNSFERMRDNDVIIVKYEQVGYPRLNRNMAQELDRLIQEKMVTIFTLEQQSGNNFRAALKSSW